MTEPGFGAKQVHREFPGVTDRAGPRRAEQGSHGHAGELGHDREDALGAGPQENRLDAHERGCLAGIGAGFVSARHHVATVGVPALSLTSASASQATGGCGPIGPHLRRQKDNHGRRRELASRWPTCLALRVGRAIRSPAQVWRSVASGPLVGHQAGRLHRGALQQRPQAADGYRDPQRRRRAARVGRPRSRSTCRRGYTPTGRSCRWPRPEPALRDGRAGPAQAGGHTRSPGGGQTQPLHERA